MKKRKRQTRVNEINPLKRETQHQADLTGCAVSVVDGSLFFTKTHTHTSTGWKFIKFRYTTKGVCEWVSKWVREDTTVNWWLAAECCNCNFQLLDVVFHFFFFFSVCLVEEASVNEWRSSLQSTAQQNSEVVAAAAVVFTSGGSQSSTQTHTQRVQDSSLGSFGFSRQLTSTAVWDTLWRV